MAAAKRSSPDAGSEPANRIAEDQSRRASGCPRARPTPLSLANSRAGKNAEPGAAAAFRSIEFVNEQQWRASINSTFRPPDLAGFFSAVDEIRMSRKNGPGMGVRFVNRRYATNAVANLSSRRDGD